MCAIVSGVSCRLASASARAASSVRVFAVCGRLVLRKCLPTVLVVSALFCFASLRSGPLCFGLSGVCSSQVSDATRTWCERCCAAVVVGRSVGSRMLQSVSWCELCLHRVGRRRVASLLYFLLLFIIVCFFFFFFITIIFCFSSSSFSSLPLLLHRLFIVCSCFSSSSVAAVSSVLRAPLLHCFGRCGVLCCSVLLCVRRVFFSASVSILFVVAVVVGLRRCCCCCCCACLCWSCGQLLKFSPSCVNTLAAGGYLRGVCHCVWRVVSARKCFGSRRLVSSRLRCLWSARSSQVSPHRVGRFCSVLLRFASVRSAVLWFVGCVLFASFRRDADLV